MRLSFHFQDFDPEFGSVKIGSSSSRGRGGAVSEAVAGARRPGRRERKFTSDEIKKFIEDAEVLFNTKMYLIKTDGNELMI